MKDGYFDPRDVKSARRCMRKSDEFIVAIGDYRLLSCIELAHAEAYIDKHNKKMIPIFTFIKSGMPRLTK